MSPSICTSLYQQHGGTIKAAKAKSVQITVPAGQHTAWNNPVVELLGKSPAAGRQVDKTIQNIYSLLCSAVSIYTLCTHRSAVFVAASTSGEKQRSLLFRLHNRAARQKGSSPQAMGCSGPLRAPRRKSTRITVTEPPFRRAAAAWVHRQRHGRWNGVTPTSMATSFWLCLPSLPRRSSS